MIYTKFYKVGEYNRREILRYCGSGENPAVVRLMEECIGECAAMNNGSVCWREIDVKPGCDGVDMPFAKAESRALAKNLAGCDRAVIFAATIGIAADRLIRRAVRTDMAKAVMLQAIGAERIETLCDIFCNEIKKSAAERGLYTRPRFSPGYGDLPLEFQRRLIRELDCRRRIGITLNESLLMSPSKSVTAIIGLSKNECRIGSGCAYCGKKDCMYRKEEK